MQKVAILRLLNELFDLCRIFSHAIHLCQEVQIIPGLLLVDESGLFWVILNHIIVVIESVWVRCIAKVRLIDHPIVVLEKIIASARHFRIEIAHLLLLLVPTILICSLLLCIILRQYQQFAQFGADEGTLLLACLHVFLRVESLPGNLYVV